MSPAAGHDDTGDGTYGPTQRAYALPQVLQVVQAGDFEDVLTPGQRRLVIVLAAVQFTLAGFAWTDLALRPAEAINGRKRLWACLIAVNFVGPLAYLRWGRRLYADERR